MSIPVGIVGIGTYFPPQIETAAELAARSGIPADVLREKMGIRQRHVAGPEDTITGMATRAAQRALDQAGIAPEQVDLVMYHGSEFKDHNVWNAAAQIQFNLGAVNGYAFEIHALCASAPIALNTVRGLMQTDDSLNIALLTVASRENDLINFRNPRSRFMFNFGAGAGAMVLQRGSTRNQILGAAAITDGALAHAVILGHAPDAIGEEPPITGDLYGKLDVVDLDVMGERLGQTSLPNFIKVITQAVERSGAALSDVRFLGLTHMKRSFYQDILASVGLTPEQGVYLEDHGHVQSADQALAIELGLAQGKIHPGDLIVLAGAGTGYTWSAAAVRWG